MVIPSQNLKTFSAETAISQEQKESSQRRFIAILFLTVIAAEVGKLYMNLTHLLLSERQAPSAAFSLLQKWRTASWLNIQQKYSVEEGNVHFPILIISKLYPCRPQKRPPNNCLASN